MKCAISPRYSGFGRLIRALLLVAAALGWISGSTTVLAHNPNPPEAVPDDEPCECEEDATAGDPIHLASGDFFLDYSDLPQAGPMDLHFRMRYVSDRIVQGPVGPGWAFNYNMRVYENDDGGLLFRNHTGRRITFDVVGSELIARDSDRWRAEITGGGEYEIRSADNWIYRFDSDGKVTSVENGRGAKLVMTYNPAGKIPIMALPPRSHLSEAEVTVRDYQLLRVEEVLDTTASGRFLEFQYEAMGRMTNVVDQAGRNVALEYDEFGGLARIVDPVGRETTFAYSERWEITFFRSDRKPAWTPGVVTTYEADTTLNLVTYAREQQMGDSFPGTSFILDNGGGYNDKMLTYTIRDHNGDEMPDRARTEIVRFVMDDTGRRRVSEREVQLPDSRVLTKSLDYTPEGNVQERITPAGRRTVMAYNSWGLMTQEIRYISDEVQVISEWDYDGSNDLVEERVYQTDRPGEVFRTEYEYDNHLMTARKVDLDVGSGETFATETFEFNAKGLMTREVSARGYGQTLEYDSVTGLLTRRYHEEDTSVETLYSHDPYGNVARETDGRSSTHQRLYDAAGRMLAETNALGEVSLMSYEGPFLVQTENGRVGSSPGRKQRFSYDPLGREAVVSRLDIDNGDAEQLVTGRAFDSEGNVLFETNAAGDVTSFEYDAMNWLVAVHRPRPGGGTMSELFEHDLDGNVIKKTDGAGAVFEYEYDGLGRLTNEIHAVGTPFERSIATHHDADGNVVATIIRQGSETSSTFYTYDGASRRIAVSGDRELPTAWSFDPVGNLVGTTNGEGHVTLQLYDELDRLESVVHPDGATETFGYDEAGNQILRTDGAGHHQAFAYDALNRMQHTSIPLGVGVSRPSGWESNPSHVLRSVSYNRFGDVAIQSDAGGGIMRSAYDGFGRLSEQVSAAGLTNSYTYDVMDNVTAIGFPAVAGSGAGATAIQNVYFSDAATFLESMTDRCGNTTTYGYDALLRQSVVESSLGSVTTLQFDPLGRLATNVVTTGGSNLVTTMFYNVLDQATNIVHPDGKTEVRAYDSFGQMIAQSGAGQYPIDYGYDLAGNRTNMVDGNGSETAWIYDGRNRVVQKIYADGSSYHYGYDGAGNLTNRLDAKGVTTAYVYTPYNLLATIDYATDADVQFAYDIMGRRTLMIDGTGTNTWAFDAAGRLTTNVQTFAGAELRYTYDVENNRRSMTVLIGTNAPWVTDYTYDACSRLSELTDHNVSNDPFVYAWHPDASLVASITMPSGAQQTKAYDDLGRLTSIAALDSLDNQINRFGYSYDLAGQRWQRTVESNTVERIDIFSYNDRRELVDVTSTATNYNYGWTYDPIGNWLSDTNNGEVTTYTANNLNQYTAISGQVSAPKFDANGNMTNDHLGNILEWDEENRLVRHIRLSGGYSTFNHDGLSRRIQTVETVTGTAPFATQTLVYDDRLVIAELGDGTINASITRGLDPVEEAHLRGGVGNILAEKRQGLGFLFYDGNGNVVRIVDDSEIELARYGYSPFGDVANAEGPQTDQPWRWSTQRSGDLTSLVSYLYRDFQAGVGRWLNRDPSHEKGGANLYAFCDNDPIGRTDVWGLYWTVEGVSRILCCEGNYKWVVDFLARIPVYQFYYVTWDRPVIRTIRINGVDHPVPDIVTLDDAFNPIVFGGWSDSEVSVWVRQGPLKNDRQTAAFLVHEATHARQSAMQSLREREFEAWVATVEAEIQLGVPENLALAPGLRIGIAPNEVPNIDAIRRYVDTEYRIHSDYRTPEVVYRLQNRTHGWRCPDDY